MNQKFSFVGLVEKTLIGAASATVMLGPLAYVGWHFGHSKEIAEQTGTRIKACAPILYGYKDESSQSLPQKFEPVRCTLSDCMNGDETVHLGQSNPSVIPWIKLQLENSNTRLRFSPSPNFDLELAQTLYSWAKDHSPQIIASWEKQREIVIDAALLKGLNEHAQCSYRASKTYSY